MRSAEIAQRREEQEQCRKEQEMEQVARLQHEEDEISIDIVTQNFTVT